MAADPIYNDDLQAYIIDGGLEHPPDIEEFGEMEVPDEGTPEYTLWYMHAAEAAQWDLFENFLGELKRARKLEESLEESDKRACELERETMDLKAKIEALEAELKALKAE